MANVIITGASGRLGSELVKYFPGAYTDYFDIRDIKSVSDVFSKVKPKLVIHCAAMTDVVECEKNPVVCYSINTFGTEVMAEMCNQTRAKMVYISTDHVFDGKHNNGWWPGHDETDIPNPTSVYAKSKLMGEWLTLSSPKNLVIRTSFMKDFKFKKAYADKFFSGERVETIALWIKKAIDMKLVGLYHIAGKRKSIYELARTINPDVGLMYLEERPNNDYGMPYLKDTTLDIRKWEDAQRTHRWKHKF